jgi:hypothetical protein
MPALQYKPLDKSKRSTRLLTVKKASGYAEITCELREIDLEDQPRFIALSYTWNTGGGLDSLTCNGTTVQAGKNLCDFLRRFRTDHDLPLWIDALCMLLLYSELEAARWLKFDVGIDQENIDERNHQVTQMASIYSSAMFTIAWLGEATGNEGLAFEPAMDLINQYDFQTKQYTLKIKRDQLHFEPRQYSFETRQAMIELLKKPYWCRVWVIQEFLLAAHVEIWCGEHRVDAPNFRHALRVARYESELIQYHYSSTVEYWEAHNTPGWKMIQYRHLMPQWTSEQTGSPFQLRNLLRAFATSQCTQRHDAIYALLGVARDATQAPNPVIPDYRKSTTQVLLDVLCNQSRCLTIDDPRQAEFLNCLRQKLGVSRLELATYIAENAPDALPHMLVLCEGLVLFVQVRFLGSATRWSNAMDPEECLEPPDMQDLKWFAAEQVTVLPWQRKFTGFRTIKAVYLAYSQKLIRCMLDITHNPLPIDRVNQPHLDHAGLAGLLQYSFLECIEFVKGFEKRFEEGEPWSEDTFFKCNNGHRGFIQMTDGWVGSLQGAQVATLTYNSQPRVALLVQPTKEKDIFDLETVEENDWTIVGSAYMMDHPASSEPPVAPSEDLPQTSLRLPTSTSPESNDSIQVSTITLMKLVLWGVVDRTQLATILKTSLESDSINPDRLQDSRDVELERLM